MELNDVTALFLHIEHVDVSIFAIRTQSLHFIHRFVLNETDIDLLEILAEVLVRNEECSVATRKRLLGIAQKSFLVLVFYDQVPKAFVTLVALSIPFILTPRISKFDHSIRLM